RTGPGGELETHKKHAVTLSEYCERFGPIAELDQDVIGLAVAVNDGAEYAVVFEDHSLFLRYFDPLVASAAVEVLQRGPGKGRTGMPNTLVGVNRLVQQAFQGTYDAGRGATRIRLSDRTIGTSFVWNGVPVRTVLYGAPLPETGKVQYAIPKEKAVRVVETYRKRFDGAPPSTRARLARDLGCVDSPRAAYLLKEWLADKDLAVRRAVLEALARCGDPKDDRLAEGLVAMLKENRKNPALFRSIAETLAKLGNPAAVDDFLGYLDSSDPMHVDAMVATLPELLLQVRDRRILEKAIRRLITLYEAAETSIRQNEQPTGQPPRKPDARNYKALVGPLEKVLQLVTGKAFATAAGFRAWWNDRTERETFLRERTGR
ncbi:MAG: HEAT repeat domain-containing protein, partial [Planctomycetota bacterium]